MTAKDFLDLCFNARWEEDMLDDLESFLDQIKEEYYIKGYKAAISEMRLCLEDLGDCGE